MTNKLLHPELTQWINNMGVAQLFNSQDLQSGKTVAVLLQNVDRGSKVQLQQGTTAITRITNWNAITERIKSLGIKLNQEDKNKIINGNHEIVFKVISKLKQAYEKSSKQTQINLKDFDNKKDIAQADSLLQLMLLAIIKHFSLTPKEALSLLSNDSKYLAHILAKGLKNDFKPIQNFMHQLLKNLNKIITFFKNKQNQIFFIRSVKPALISKSQTVAQLSLNLIDNYLSIYETSVRTQLIRQHFISTLMLVIRRHPHLIDVVLNNTLKSTKYSNDILQEIVANSNKNQLTSILISLWNIYKEKKSVETFIKTEAFQKLITHLNTSVKQPELALSSITAFLELASTNFSLISSTSSEALLNAFRDMNFNKESDNLVYIHVCCSLMKLAGQQKHSIAPLIFKFLTSKLISTLNTQYQSILLNIKQVITEIPSIPTLPILQALSQRAELKITQIQLQMFARILQLGAQVKSAVAIFNIISRSLVEDVGLGLQIGNILCQVIVNFQQQQIILDMTSKLIKVGLAIYFANSKKLSQKRKPFSYKNKLDNEQSTFKLKILQIQNFLKKVILIDQKQINNNIQPLICFSYVQIKNLNRDHTHHFQSGIQKIVQLFGSLNDMMNKYKDQIQENQDIANPSKANKNDKVKNNRSYVQTQGQSDFNKLPKRIKSVHPNSLSLAGVKPDAYSGIQKFSKMHEVKKLEQQSNRYQAIKIEQDRQKLKKVYAKKMMVDKGFKYKNINQADIQYLFQFGSKEAYADAQSLHLNYFSNEEEEDRDCHGLQNLLKRYEKALRAYFNIYSGLKSGYHPKYFHQYSEKNSYIHSSRILKIIIDHGLQNFITPKEVTSLIRNINYRFNKTKDDPQLLDFDGFKQCIVQMAFTMYSRPPKDLRGYPMAEMIEELFSHLKLYAKQNLISTQLFQQPESISYLGQSQAIKNLNKTLQQNSDYILPQGYKKITQTKILYDYKIYLEAMSVPYKEVYEVLDQILFNNFKFHIIEPFTKEEKIITARPNIYHLDRIKYAETADNKHIPTSLKKQVAKFPIKDRITAKEAASALGDIIQAVELQHDSIGIKHENPYLKSIKQKQQMQRSKRQIQKRKFQNLNRQIKTTMSEYTMKKSEIKEKEQQQKRNELEKKKQQKQKRQRYEKELKAKVQQYSQQKKSDQEAKKASQQSRIAKQKQQAEKKKRQAQQIKKKIQQLKKEKQQQEKQRKQKQKADEKKKKLEQKAKYEKMQREKKQMIQSYKQSKKGQTKALDQSHVEKYQTAENNLDNNQQKV